MIVQYYADSLGLSRPKIVELNQRYIFLFEKWLRENNKDDIFIINRARGGLTIDKLFELFNEDEEYIKDTKDILIIHEGVCDCAPRPIPLSLKKFIGGLPNFIKHRIIAYLHHNRSKLLKRGHVHYEVDKIRYEKLLKEWLTKAINRFKVIYIFNIAPTNNQIEIHSPGFSKSIVQYNDIIKKVVNEFKAEHIHLIDVHNLILQSTYPLDELIVKEDGHHITPLTHEMYTNQLIQLEKKRLQSD